MDKQLGRNDITLLSQELEDSRPFQQKVFEKVPSICPMMWELISQEELKIIQSLLYHELR